MGLKITLSGQDITAYVDEMSLDIDDTLGQGPGVVTGTSGRASTAKFLTTLGPTASASGAGSSITQPTLTRQGEVQITDATGTLVYGGYAGKITDKTDKIRNYSQIECYDYWQHLDRIQIQAVFSGQTDVQIMRSLFTTYAPWIDLSTFPTAGTYTFTVQVYKAISLQKALQKITDVTGFQIWITPDKRAHYVPPLQSGTAPFALSTAPDFITSFPFGFEGDGYVIDDTSAINRVTFYGGKIPSNDFTQDLSTQANGSNKLFVLGYYPRVASDGKIHVKDASNFGTNDLVLGYLLGIGVQNQLKSQGGQADVLLNADAHTLTFDIAPINQGPNTVTAKYRYEFPLTVQIVDQTAFQFYGAYYDGVISDSTVFDKSTGVARCRTLLTEQSRGLTTLKVHCFKPGLLSGMVLQINHPIRGINNVPFLVQEVETVPLGAGNFKYIITAGAWRWHLVDILLGAAHAAYQAGVDVSADPNNNGQPDNPLQIQQVLGSLKSSITARKATRVYGQYYARSTPVGDGHDAYPGLSTISS